MNIKPMIAPYPPLSIRAAGYPIHVFRVEKSPRLQVNSPAAQSNTVPPALHAHRSYEVFFVVSGTLELITEQSRKVYSDSIVIIPPRIHHVTVRNGESYCLLFSFEQEDWRMPVSDGNFGALPLEEATVFYIRQLTDQTLLRTVTGEEAAAWLASLLFLDIFGKLPPQMAGAFPRNHRAAHISRIDEFINITFTEFFKNTGELPLSNIASRNSRRIQRRNLPVMPARFRLHNSVAFLLLIRKNTLHCRLGWSVLFT